MKEECSKERSARESDLKCRCDNEEQRIIDTYIPVPQDDSEKDIEIPVPCFTHQQALQMHENLALYRLQHLELSTGVGSEDIAKMTAKEIKWIQQTKI